MNPKETKPRIKLSSGVEIAHFQGDNGETLAAVINQGDRVSMTDPEWREYCELMKIRVARQIIGLPVGNDGMGG